MSSERGKYAEQTPLYTPNHLQNDSLLSESYEEGGASAGPAAKNVYDCLVGGSLETIDEKSKSEMECTMTAEAADDSAPAKQHDSDAKYSSAFESQEMLSAAKSCIKCFMCGQQVERKRAADHARECIATSEARSKKHDGSSKFAKVKAFLDAEKSAASEMQSSVHEDSVR